MYFNENEITLADSVVVYINYRIIHYVNIAKIYDFHWNWDKKM